MNDDQQDLPKNTVREDCYKNYVSSFKFADGEAMSIHHPGHRQWLLRKYWCWLTEVASDDPVLELGCGSGDLLCFLTEMGLKNVEGIDISAEQIQLAKKKGCSVREADAFDTLSEKPETYGAILAMDFFEHFSKDELNRLMSLVFKALKPGGILLLQTPNGASPLAAQISSGDLTHTTILAPSSLAQLLRMAGFTNIHHTETGPVPAGFSGTLRTILWRVLRAGANAVKRIEAGKTQDIWTENMICCCRKPQA